MNDEIRAQVIVGDDAETFVAGELGQAVLKIAAQDLDAAVLAFADADTSDDARIRELQLQVRLAMRFERYLSEIITRGREALAANNNNKEGHD